jgi:hypothetical protein
MLASRASVAVLQEPCSQWLAAVAKISSLRSLGVGITVRRGAAAGEFLVIEPIYRAADPACCPSGGTAAATWALKQATSSSRVALHADYGLAG